MNVRVKITKGPLQGAMVSYAANAGAILAFDGIVRPTEAEKPIIALDYEAYRPMADNLLRQLGEELLAKHKLLALHVEHSNGRVLVGECSFRLQIASEHRQEALAAMAEFIDRMKQDVPIWKTPVFQPDTGSEAPKMPATAKSDK